MLPLWTGFHGKTLWDWLQMLIIPLVLAVGAFYIDIAASYIEADRQQEESMKSYFHEMTGLLLDKQLRSADKDSEVRSIARVMTLTTLRKMNGVRKGFILLFLSDLKLISRDAPIISLSGANLYRADLTGLDLSNTNLENVYLSEAKFASTTIDNANLSNSVLSNATQIDTDVTKAHLCKTYLPDGTKSDRDCPK